MILWEGGAPLAVRLLYAALLWLTATLCSLALPFPDIPPSLGLGIPPLPTIPPKFDLFCPLDAS